MAGALERTDPEIFAAIARETERQRYNLELIASENIVTEAVLEAQGSVLTNKYAEGLPGKRYYGGCEFVDQVEQLAIDRACALFGAEGANVQPHSGAQANMCVYFAELDPGDTIALGDELARLVVDHLPVTEQAVEVLLELFLRIHLAGKGSLGGASSERASAWTISPPHFPTPSGARKRPHWRRLRMAYCGSDWRLPAACSGFAAGVSKQSTEFPPATFRLCIPIAPAASGSPAQIRCTASRCCSRPAISIPAPIRSTKL